MIPQHQKIAKDALDAVNTKKPKNPRDAMHRFNQRQKLSREWMDIQNRDAQGVFPSFQNNFDKGSRTGILIPAKL
jgi:hypothetical protein